MPGTATDEITLTRDALPPDSIDAAIKLFSKAVGVWQTRCRDGRVCPIAHVSIIVTATLGVGGPATHRPPRKAWNNTYQVGKNEDFLAVVIKRGADPSRYNFPG